MNQTQKLVVVIYCLLIAYCCVWVPWSVNDTQSGIRRRFGYGWLWAGPRVFVSVSVTESNPVTLSAEERASLPQYRADEVEVATEKPQPPIKPKERKVLVPDLDFTEPDVWLIVLRFITVTALGCAAFLLSGMLTSSMWR